MRLPRSVVASRCAAASLCAAALGVDASAAADDGDRFAIRFEGGVGAMLSDFHGAEGGHGVAWQGSARLAFVLADPLVMQFGVSNWAFPSNAGGTGWAFVPSGGFRVEPRVGGAGRFWVDAHAGVGLSGDEARLAVDFGMGFEFQPTALFVFGPMVRYGQIIQPGAEDGSVAPLTGDARFFSAGLTLALRLPPRRPRAVEARPIEAAAAPVEPEQPPRVRDTDGDGVSDAEDLCVRVHHGEHPDPTRAGCPTPDSDFDTVLDPDDRCVTVPQGPHPDPRRRGCPSADDDGDGVFNEEDLCPTQPATATPALSRPGCPDGDRDSDGVRDGIDRCVDDRETYNGVEDGDGCPERGLETSVELDPTNHVVTIHGTVNFITGSATLVGRASFDLLDGLANLLRQHPEIALVEIQGHTDRRGNRGLNIALSRRRAQAVVQYLVGRGVAPERLRAEGYGPDRPIDPRNLPEAWNVNRRTEVHVIRWSGQTTGAQAP